MVRAQFNILTIYHIGCLKFLRFSVLWVYGVYNSSNFPYLGLGFQKGQLNPLYEICMSAHPPLSFCDLVRGDPLQKNCSKSAYSRVCFGPICPTLFFFSNADPKVGFVHWGGGHSSCPQFTKAHPSSDGILNHKLQTITSFY